MREDDPVSTIIDELSWRGLIAQSTDLDALRAATAAGPVTLYCGFDPTAPSLHLGNLVQILTVRRFQQHGHRPLALVGGATGLIGDPKETGERTLNPREVVEGWVQRIREQLDRFYDFDGPNAAVAVNNLDWTEGMGVLEFLRDVGKHFSVNRMLDREAVAARLAKDGISYTEFSYQLLQSYDFVQLYRRFGCTLQTGGSDQWGNIVAGVDLIRRMDGGSAHALTTPAHDEVGRHQVRQDRVGHRLAGSGAHEPLRVLPVLAELRRPRRRLAAAHVQLPGTGGDRQRCWLPWPSDPRPARPSGPWRASSPRWSTGRRSVTLPRRPGARCSARATSATCPPTTLGAALAEAPNVEIPAAEVVDGLLPAYDELFARTGLAASKSAARRTIDEGGAYANNVRVTDPAAQPALSDLHHGEWLVLRRGKKAFAGVRVAQP